MGERDAKGMTTEELLAAHRAAHDAWYVDRERALTSKQESPMPDRPVRDVLGEASSGAVISDSGFYRYLLWRRWDMSLPRVLFIMLNPSTADARIDDPTIRRCIGFAKAWGFGGLRVVNLYPFRATKPADLWAASDRRGVDNLGYIERAIDTNGIAVAAWGAHGKEADVRAVRNLFYELGVPLYALKLTKDGAPGHPLYIAGDTIPIVYEPARNPLTKGQPWMPASPRPATGS